VHRRALLRSLVPGAAALPAGCTGSGTDPDDDGAVTGTPTPSSATYRVVDRSVTVLANGCGAPTGEIDATLVPDSPAPDAERYRLTVSGVATGNDSCHTVRLASLDPGEPGGTMTLGVETYVPDADADAVCLECLAAIEYELVVTTVNGRPGRVAVTHDGKRAGHVELPE
jgi:hypothetical protein